MIRAKRSVSVGLQKPSLARAEILDKAVRARFESEIEHALKRRPSHEGKLAGALRALAPFSHSLRTSVAEIAAILVRRGSRERELYGASLRILVETQDRTASSLLRTSLASEEAGGTASLSAAGFSRDPVLAPLLSKVAASRQSHVAFGAELARAMRGESNGSHLFSLAPMIKESHRIAMCGELFLPLTRAEMRTAPLGPALSVLRGAERHLGRWLVMGEAAVRAGDITPIQEAAERAKTGTVSSRAGWSLVLWALQEATGQESGSGGTNGSPPETRPTLELIARLSDRPSADRDTTFLFRMARARATTTRPILEGLAKEVILADESAIRAALYLARDHGREDMREALVVAATGAKPEELRGLACAALWDSAVPGANDRARERAREIADDLVASRVIGNVAWGALIRVAAKRASVDLHGADQRGDFLTGEAAFRWIQWGAAE